MSGSELDKVLFKFILVCSSMAFLVGFTLPVYYLLLLDKGFDLSQIGILVLIFSISTIVLEVPCGVIADKYGKKKSFLLGEFTLIVVTACLWLLDDFLAICGVMVLNGLSRSLFSGALDALFIQQASKTKEVLSGKVTTLQIQAKLSSVSMFCLALGCIVGASTPSIFNHFVPSHELISFIESCYVVLLPLLLIHFFLTLFVINENTEEMEAQIPVKKTLSIKRPLSQTQVVLLGMFLMQVVLGGVYISVDMLWQPKLAELLDVKQELWKFGVFCSLGFICASFGHKLSVKFSQALKGNLWNMILVVLFLTAISMYVLSKQNGFISFTLIYCVINFLFGVFSIPVVTTVNQLVSDNERATALSTLSFFRQLGTGAGGMIAGLVVQSYGLSTIWLAMSLGCVSVCLIVWLVGKKVAKAGIVREPVNEHR